MSDERYIERFIVISDAEADSSEVHLSNLSLRGDSELVLEKGRMVWNPRVNEYAKVNEDGIGKPLKVTRGALGSEAQDWQKGDRVWIN